MTRRWVWRSAFFIGVALALATSAPVGAQEIPANARAASYGQGWVCDTGYLERDRACVHFSAATDSEVRQLIVRQSVAAYSGSCACPYNVDRGGR